MSLHARKVGDVPKENHTTVRSLRSDGTVWDPFGDVVGSRARSAWLNDFMGWVAADPAVWTAARERHGDELGAVLAQFLAWQERRPGAKLPPRVTPPPA